MSANPPEGVKGPDAFGKRLAADVLKLIGTIQIDRTESEGLELVATREEMKFPASWTSRTTQIRFALGKAFFPELIGFFEKEYKEGVRPTVTVALLDRSLGFVGFSGEMFCEHAVALRHRARLPISS